MIEIENKPKNLLSEEPEPKDLTIDEAETQFIINTIVKFSNVSFVKMESKTRDRKICIPRQLAMFFLILNGNMSLKKIGEKFGNRDHSTVIHARQTMIDLYLTNKHFKNNVEKLIEEINPAFKTKLIELILNDRPKLEGLLK